MKRVLGVLLILLLVLSLGVPTPANAGGRDWLIGGALFGGGFLLGSVLAPRDRIIVGPVYSAYPSRQPYGYYPPPVYYPPPIYYSPPIVYQPPPMRWIPAHYEWRWQTSCEIMYQRPNCYSTPITVFIPGHWEY